MFSLWNANAFELFLSFIPMRNLMLYDNCSMAWCNDLDILTMSMYTSIMLSSLWIRIQSCHVLSKTDIYIFFWFLPSFCSKLTIKAYHVISVSLTCHHITYFLIVYSIAYTLGVPLGRLIYKCIYWCRLNTYIVSNNSNRILVNT